MERKSPACKTGIKRSQVLCPGSLFNEERYEAVSTHPDGIARKHRADCPPPPGAQVA